MEIQKLTYTVMYARSHISFYGFVNHSSDHNSRRKTAAAKLIQSYWRFYSYIKNNREHLAWKRMRQIAHVKKLKNHLYAKLHEWREYKKMNGNILFDVLASMNNHA